MATFLLRHWYKQSVSWLALLLLPLSWLFRMIVFVRCYLYRIKLLKSCKLNVPVIVIGNITVGGTGKTPFVIWLSNWLKQQGYKPGIVSRGVGSAKHDQPYLVTTESSVADSGDEALMLAQRTNLPVMIHPDRVKAVQYLLDQCHCDVVISDDGLQHYRLARDMEIVIVDGVRQFGNHQLLPAGPLREPVSRLQEVDFTVVNGVDVNDQFCFSVVPESLRCLDDASTTNNIHDFNGKTVHAVAGIGHPERFFALLEEAGMKVIKHVFADHHHYQRHDIMFDDGCPVIMTKKDAVKCKQFGLTNSWYLEITIAPNDRLKESLLSQIKKMETGYAKQSNTENIRNTIGS